MFTFGDATPQLIDYSGGGTPKNGRRHSTARSTDFDTVVPGHGVVTTKRECEIPRQQMTLRNRIHEMDRPEEDPG